MGHVELASSSYTSPQDLQEKIFDDFKHKFLVVHVKKYPNLLKCYQKGNVTIRAERLEFQRLCHIKSKEVRVDQVLDLDRLAQTMPPTSRCL